MKKQTTYKKFLGIDIANEKVVYEPSFRDDIIYTKGLKRFLLDFSSIEEKEVIEVKLWEEYLMFASILGIADEVEKQIGKLCPEFNQYSNIDYTYTMLATRTFMYGGVRSAANAYSAAHSSSYSGGGGFSSFGGGGGGFSGGGGGGSDKIKKTWKNEMNLLSCCFNLGGSLQTPGYFIVVLLIQRFYQQN